MFEKAFMYNFFDKEQPVRFGFSPEEREWLKKERTTEELIDFIKENALQLAIGTAQHNNDFGFASIPAAGEIIRNGDSFVFRMDTSTDEEKRHMDIAINPMTDEEYSEYQKYKKYMYYEVICLSGKDEIMLISACDPDGDEYLSDLLREKVMACFLEEAGVNSYHKLGKLINKCQRIYNEWEDENNSLIEKGLF